MEHFPDDSAFDDMENHPLNMSVGNVKDHLLNAGCLLVIHWQLVPFEAIMLASIYDWQLFPLVIESLSAAGKMNHNWHVGGIQDHLLNAGCLLMIHWKLVPFGAIVTAVMYGTSFLV